LNVLQVYEFGSFISSLPDSNNNVPAFSTYIVMEEGEKNLYEILTKQIREKKAQPF
jgi:hypothetical protein